MIELRNGGLIIKSKNYLSGPTNRQSHDRLSKNNVIHVYLTIKQRSLDEEALDDDYDKKYRPWLLRY